MDPVTLAAQVVGVLAPALPYLLGRVGQRALDEAGERLGAEAWNRAKALWARLRPKVESRPAVAEAAQEVAEHPDDEDSRAVLRVQLRKVLSEDDALALELARIVGPSGRFTYVSARGERHVVAGGNITGSTIIHGGVTHHYGSGSTEVLARASGPARAVLGLGMLVAFVGFVLFMFPIVTAIAAPPEFGEFPEVTPWVPLGVGLTLAGMLIMGIGTFMVRSKDH